MDREVKRFITRNRTELSKLGLTAISVLAFIGMVAPVTYFNNEMVNAAHSLNSLVNHPVPKEWINSLTVGGISAIGMVAICYRLINPALIDLDIQIKRRLKLVENRQEKHQLSVRQRRRKKRR
ncbi:hypothetical protein A2866_04655 [Candidatus Roizmanbacteria bacterium RIFCSPHIGHO2_01_FULL_39_8]|uniref:MotA/TolQ/ExbB proton channel domain-containing protein n=2 Tax=Candidatus Roizmaniibacteriota TaxID=1752723 RepID=A0A1F7GP78_9BACT|nr:MAG: hypothetical protein A2866_04655 [Candidatus Roizmanbacteria bacterium RIFCSPHIGHO2_01_FULL_39_8]OGK27240.1 MAG: hypothetical protein A3C28_04375 [Candidatus Roizmanbacteria bacterium RIFCSPHIGHO2_02_FULL_39_9]